jgi:predicted nucleic acid-binding protein
LGLLVIAKNKGIITTISPFLDLLADSLLYINPKLLAQVKVMAGE